MGPTIGFLLFFLPILAFIKFYVLNPNRHTIRKCANELTSLAEKSGMKGDFIHTFQNTGILIDKTKNAVVVIASHNKARSPNDFIRRIISKDEAKSISTTNVSPGVSRLVITLNDFDVPSVLVAGFTNQVDDLYEKLALIWDLR